MRRGSPAILALDCSAGACSAALWRDSAILAHRFEAMGRGQAEALIPMIETVMEEAGLRYAALDLVAATVGPGSFTGLRIGLAAARGIALAAGIPAAGVTSFAAVAESVAADATDGRDLAVAIDDRRGGVYWQDFDAARQPAQEPRAVDADGLVALLARLPEDRRLWIAGDGAPVLARAMRAAGTVARAEFAAQAGPPDAASVARVAARTWSIGDVGLPPMPLYLRAPEARLPGAARQ